MAKYKLTFRDGYPPRRHTFLAASATEALMKAAKTMLGEVVVSDTNGQEIGLEELRRLANDETGRRDLEETPELSGEQPNAASRDEGASGADSRA